MSTLKKQSKKQYGWFVAIVAVLIAIAAIIYLLVAPSDPTSKPIGGGKISITTTIPVDLGTFPIRGGKVTAKFTFRNTGSGDLSILKGETSCMCTVATIEKNGESISPKITMPMGVGSGPTRLDVKLAPGEEAQVVAVFDPMAHGPTATGPIKRDVILTTDSALTPEVKFSFFGNVAS